MNWDWAVVLWNFFRVEHQMVLQSIHIITTNSWKRTGKLLTTATLNVSISLIFATSGAEEHLINLKIKQMIGNIQIDTFIVILMADGFTTGILIQQGKWLISANFRLSTSGCWISGDVFSSVLEITADVSAICPTDLTHWLDYCETYLKENSTCGYGKWYHGNYTIQPPKCVHT